jgi:predicted kinase
MAFIHLIEGPVGAGKSTFATQLGRELPAPRLALDDWMATLFRPDRPPTGVIEWYAERKDRCIDQMWKMACEIVDAGSDVILELGLIRRTDRERIYDRIDAAHCGLKLYVIDAPREVRRDRVRKRNTDKGVTYSMEVPDHFFEMASDLWEPVDAWECNLYPVKFISTENQ